MCKCACVFVRVNLCLRVGMGMGVSVSVGVGVGVCVYVDWQSCRSTRIVFRKEIRLDNVVAATVSAASL